MKYYCHNPSAEKFIYTDFVRDLRESDDVPYINIRQNMTDKRL